MTLDKKILIGLTGCSLVLVFVAVISFRNSEEFISTSEWVSHTHEVLYELDQVLINAINVQTGVRGFVITGSERYLEPFTQGKQTLLGHFSAAQELTRDNPAQQKNLADLKPWIDRHLSFLATQVNLRRTASDLVSAPNDVDYGKEIMDEIRLRLRQSREIEQKLLAVRRASSEERADNFNLLFSLLLSSIVVVLVTVYFIIMANLKALRRAERETNDRNWGLTGTGALVRGMQGNKPVPELARVIIDHMATFLHAHTGALYISNPALRTLEVTGTYALDKSKTDFPQVRYGEGLVGQAAADKRAILLDDIPEHHFSMHTTFGSIAPKNIIAQPFLFEDTVIGVIELGTLQGFSDIQKQYLQLSADSIAIAFTSAQARAKAADLLRETQLQGEELVSQQEELRQSNEELLVKTEALERTELELRTQQEELRQTNDALEERANLLQDQKRALEDAKTLIENKAREIEITSKYKSEFLANMSHELRTPLNSILILAQLLSENKNNVLGKKEIEFARNIHNSGKDLLNLINEILDLSKIEAGKMHLDITDVALPQVVTSTYAMFTELALSRNVAFQIDFQEETLPGTLATDRQRLEQILRNLLSNAFKFTDAGGRVTLLIESVAPHASPLTAASDPVLSFAVSDTGIGIPANKQHIIFEAFQQADGSTKRKYGGTGLGLSISRELAHALGGEIRLKSTEGQGSTFTLYLPVAFRGTGHAAERQTAPAVESPMAETRQTPPPLAATLVSKLPQTADDRYSLAEGDRVMVIIGDDDIFNTSLLNTARRHRYKGIIAKPSGAGLGYTRHYRPEVIMLDMDEGSGESSELLRLIKHDPDLRHTPVIVLAAFDGRKQALTTGAFEFVRKPASAEQLLEAFNKIETFASKKYKKLLIVEDNKQQNEAIRQLIGNGDVKCFSAYRGSEAYHMLTQETYDCLIVDLGLPDMSGIELLEKIKVSDTLNQIPVIVYTGMDLTKEDQGRLARLASTVVLKTADSQERLLDEATLFLHREQSKLPKEAQTLIRKLHQPDDLLKNKKVLIVDDDMRNIYSLTNALEEEGMHCITAENGKVALALLKENSAIDLVLMDVMMPEMDGYETTMEIRKTENLKKLPIIALTAKAMKGDKEKCLAAGMSDYVSKPLDIGQLMGLMRIWMYRQPEPQTPVYSPQPIGDGPENSGLK